jgi:hypothetical protein
MRRWVCVIFLLAGLSGDGYAWSVRPRIPVAIERTLESDSPHGRRWAAADWWRPL